MARILRDVCLDGGTLPVPVVIIPAAADILLEYAVPQPAFAERGQVVVWTDGTDTDFRSPTGYRIRMDREFVYVPTMFPGPTPDEWWASLSDEQKAAIAKERT